MKIHQFCRIMEYITERNPKSIKCLNLTVKMPEFAVGGL